MKIIYDKIDVYDGASLAASCRIKVVLSWYLYPHIFITEGRYLDIPGLYGPQNHVQIALPHQQQLNWWKCLGSWKRYRTKYVIAFVANLEYWKRHGHFVSGTSQYQI